MSKKRLLGLLFLLLIAGVTYVFFSIKKTYNTQKIVSSSEECVRRHFLNKNLWQKGYFGKIINDSTFTINNTNYTITKVLFNGFHLNISNELDSLSAFVQFVSIKDPSKSIINFSTLENKNKGFIENYKYSNRLKKLEGAINQFMTSIESFFNSQQKVYGIEIKMERTDDPNLLVYKQQLKQEPTVQEIYQVIDKISAYVKSKNGSIKNPPMLNVFKESHQVYHAMIALPTTQFIYGNNEFTYKQLVKGNILTAEIKGGPHTIKQAEIEMRNYVEDNKKTSPALPYQSLITNRLTETDTTKWITKLYYPVFF